MFICKYLQSVANVILHENMNDSTTTIGTPKMANVILDNNIPVHTLATAIHSTIDNNVSTYMDDSNFVIDLPPPDSPSSNQSWTPESGEIVTNNDEYDNSFDSNTVADDDPIIHSIQSLTLLQHTVN